MSDSFEVPEGFHSVTPSLTVKNSAEALAFYANAFGAIERFQLPDEKTGGTMHAEMMIGNSIMMLSDEYPDWGCIAPPVGEGMTFMIYIEDADAALARAVEAGATETMPVTEMFWGDRCAKVNDPFGYRWTLAQHLREVTPEEIKEGAKNWGEDAS